MCKCIERAARRRTKLDDTPSNHNHYQKQICPSIPTAIAQPGSHHHSLIHAAPLASIRINSKNNLYDSQRRRSDYKVDNQVDSSLDEHQFPVIPRWSSVPTLKHSSPPSASSSSVISSPSTSHISSSTNSEMCTITALDPLCANYFSTSQEGNDTGQHIQRATQGYHFWGVDTKINRQSSRAVGGIILRFLVLLVTELLSRIQKG